MSWSWRALKTTLNIVLASILFLMMAVTFCDVVGRYFLNSPLKSAYEFNEFGLSIVTYLALPLVTINREHITVGVFLTSAGTVPGRIAEASMQLLSAVILALMSWRVFLLAIEQKKDGITSGVLHLPHWPLGYLIATMLALSSIASIVLIFRPRPIHASSTIQ